LAVATLAVTRSLRARTVIRNVTVAGESEVSGCNRPPVPAGAAVRACSRAVGLADVESEKSSRTQKSGEVPHGGVALLVGDEVVEDPAEAMTSKGPVSAGSHTSSWWAGLAGQRPAAMVSSLAEASRRVTWCPQSLKAAAWSACPAAGVEQGRSRIPVAVRAASTALIQGATGSAMKLS